MVQINELRVGNLIQEGKVEQIDNSIDEVYYSGNGYYQSNYCCNLNAILINEEWLLKLGFSCDWSKIYTKQIEENYFELRFDKTDKIIVLDVSVNYEDTSLEFQHIKYVHQLQNLYFILVGSELQLLEAEI